MKTVSGTTKPTSSVYPITVYQVDETNRASITRRRSCTRYMLASNPSTATVTDDIRPTVSLGVQKTTHFYFKGKERALGKHPKRLRESRTSCSSASRGRTQKAAQHQRACEAPTNYTTTVKSQNMPFLLAGTKTEALTKTPTDKHRCSRRTAKPCFVADGRSND